MLSIWGIVTVATVYGGLPAVVALWALERWRSGGRNRSGKCAACGVAWSDAAGSEPYLIHGRVVCEPCAEKARRRMPWHFGILGAAAAVGTAIAIAGADAGLRLMVLLPASSTLIITLGGVQVMKFANRRAQRRIARGDFPDLPALGGGDGPA